MKKKLFIIAFCCLSFWIKPADGQILDVIKGVTTKVIKAIDLKVQRLQTKTIWLQNAQKTLENEMAKLKLKQISDWAMKQRDLYQKYYKELLKVKSALSTYQRIKAIITRQKMLVQEY